MPDRNEAIPPRDRRRDVRLKAIPAETDARMLVGGAWVPIRAIVADVGGGGLLAYADRELLVNDYLEFGFTLPDTTDRIAVRAEVVWVEFLPGRVPLWRAGCCFDQTPPEVRERIGRYVAAELRAGGARAD